MFPPCEHCGQTWHTQCCQCKAALPQDDDYDDWLCKRCRMAIINRNLEALKGWARARGL